MLSLQVLLQFFLFQSPDQLHLSSLEYCCWQPKGMAVGMEHPSVFHHPASKDKFRIVHSMLVLQGLIYLT